MTVSCNRSHARRFARWLPVLLSFAGAISENPARAAVTAAGDVVPDPLAATMPVQIGVDGIGSVLIDGGSAFESGSVEIGVGNSGVGTAKIVGQGSIWTVESVAVGVNGLGRLEVRDGGILESTNANTFSVGYSATAHGTVVVADPGSLLQIRSQLRIGDSGPGIIEISNGGIVNVPEEYTYVSPLGGIQLLDGFLRTAGLDNAGLITGSGEIQAHSNGLFANSGRIEVGVGDHLVVVAPEFNMLQNRGEITANGGAIEIRSRLENELNGQFSAKITLRNGSLRVGLLSSGSSQPQLENGGLLTTIGGESHVHGAVHNEANGTIAVTNNSLAMFHDNVEAQFNSVIAVSSGSTAIFLQDLALNGGTLLADLAGATEWGHVEVFGNAQLNGNLQVNLFNGFAPAAGDSFTLLTAAGGVTDWGLHLAPTSDLPGGLEWDLDINTHSVVLRVVESLAGDYNDDGIVSAADYTVWRDLLGTDNPAADGDRSGMVDRDDYGVWKTNFGRTKDDGGGAISRPVPEPNGLATIAAVLFALLLIRPLQTGRCEV